MQFGVPIFPKLERLIYYYPRHLNPETRPQSRLDPEHGVDLLRSNHGPVVIEVNSSPGLEGTEKATNKDVAGLILDFIKNNAKPNRTRTRGKA